MSPCVCLVGLDCWEGIILGTHHEKGAFTFWSYAIGLPLPSSSILSWKFCHVLHKVLRDGHPNVSVPSQTSLPPARSFWGEAHYVPQQSTPLAPSPETSPASGVWG